LAQSPEQLLSDKEQDAEPVTNIQIVITVLLFQMVSLWRSWKNGNNWHYIVGNVSLSSLDRARPEHPTDDFEVRN
jgi:hypothetical protein